MSLCKGYFEAVKSLAEKRQDMLECFQALVNTVMKESKKQRDEDCVVKVGIEKNVLSAEINNVDLYIGKELENIRVQIGADNFLVESFPDHGIFYTVQFIFA